MHLLVTIIVWINLNIIRFAHKSHFHYNIFANGGFADGDNFVWSAIQPFGLSFNGLSTNILGIGVHLSVGHFIIANVMGGQHWVLATAASNGWMSVNDPGFNRDGYQVV